MMSQDMSKVLISPPVPFFISISQRATSDCFSDAHVIQFVLHSEQTCRDISKAFPIGQLSKKSKDIDRETGERLNLVITILAFDALSKLMKREMSKQLSKNGFSCIHRSFLVGEL